MKPRHKQSVTLLELLIAISLLGILVLAFTSIDLFSRYHVRNADIRIQLQNEASSAIEHMTKYISQGIGSVNYPGVRVHPSQQRIAVRLDRNSNGQPDDDGPTDWIAYRYAPAQDQILYRATYPPTGWPTAGEEIIAQRISFFNSTYNPSNNYVEIEIHACWDPVNAATCGTPDNPSVAMTTSIKMPAVSTH